MKQFALITGASSGIGLATAERFSKEDWEVANFSRRACPLEKIQNHLCDISDFSALRDTLKKLSFSGYERVSIIHNAAGTCKDSAMNATEKNLQKLLNINVVAPQIINQQLISLLPKGSSIIFIGSTLSERGVPDSLSYTTSKHAVAGLMKATCHDVANRGIHTCLICPGMTDTPMLTTVVFPDSAVLNSVVREVVLAQRMIQPSEIADLVFFCSINPLINGSVIHGNLGQR